MLLLKNILKENDSEKTANMSKFKMLFLSVANILLFSLAFAKKVNKITSKDLQNQHFWKGGIYVNLGYLTKQI